MRRWISAPRPARGATQALPPCISATCRTIASPSPEPGSPRASGARFNGRNILASNNSNISQLDDPQINAAMQRAEVVVDPDARARAWGRIDTMISAQAPVIPWNWDRQPLLRSADVNGAVSQFNSQCDLT